MLKLTNESMANAIRRAKVVHPKVRVISADDRTYAVSSSKGLGFYTVKFVSVNGLELAECGCRALAACFHIPAAAPLDIAVQSQRQANPTSDESKAFLRANVGWML